MVIHRVRLIVGSVSKLNDYHDLMLLSVTLSRLSAHYKLSLMVGSLSRKSAHFPLIPKHIGSISPFRVVCGRKGRIVWFFPSCCFPIFACLFIIFFPAFCSWTVISLLDFIALMKVFPCHVRFLTFVDMVEYQELLLCFCCYHVPIMWLRLLAFVLFFAYSWRK